ncbi:MAG: zinc ribbon domain-containing protein [Phycisphaerae bacterium]
MPADDLDSIGPDTDIYCLECGYNLRGLTGEPRRCPECGHLNPLGEAILPAALIRAQLDALESAPAAAVAVTLLALVVLMLTAKLMANGIGDGLLALFSLAVVAFSLAVSCWAWKTFRTSCGGDPRAARLFARFQAVGVVMCVATFLPLLGLLDFANKGAAASNWVVQRGAVVAGLVGAGGAWVLGYLEYQRVRREMRALQRDVAVRTARHVLRQRLGKQR